MSPRCWPAKAFSPSPGVLLPRAILNQVRYAGKPLQVGSIFTLILLFFISEDIYFFLSLLRIALSNTVDKVHTFKAYSNFWSRDRWWNHHYKQDNEHLHHLQKQNIFMSLFFPFTTCPQLTFSTLSSVWEDSGPGHLQVRFSPQMWFVWLLHSLKILNQFSKIRNE